MRPLQRRAVELHDDVAGLDLGAVGRELEDLQLARLHRRRQDDRPERPDLAAELEGVDELAAGHFRRRQIGHRAAADRGEETAADDEDEHGDRQEAVARAQPFEEASVIVGSPAPWRPACGRPRTRGADVSATTAPRRRRRHHGVERARRADGHGLLLVRRAVLHAHERGLAVRCRPRRAARRARPAGARA